MKAIPILPGSRFGRLVTTGETQPTPRKSARWVCRCDCGSVTAIASHELRVGKSTSCGCGPWKHGGARMTGRFPEYSVWRGMVTRCHYERDAKYGYYGGRGIRVCERWRTDFGAFYFDVGQRPSPAYSLDRLDSNGHYEPGNVRWATKGEQSRNMRSNVRLEWRGERRTASEWADQIGIGRSTLHGRLQRGWSVERALTEKAK